MLPERVYDIIGHLSSAEMELLYNLAAVVPKDGTIIEIGSFQGKSTICLGLGAKQAGAQVWAIDPHEDLQVDSQTHYGMENHAALLKNLVDFGVADTVRVIAMSASSIFDVWWSNNLIHLLWIDGSHEYNDVRSDLYWSIHVDGKIAVHDSSGHFPGVTQALNEFLAANQWHIEQQVDSTAVLVRNV